MNIRIVLEGLSTLIEQLQISRVGGHRMASAAPSQVAAIYIIRPGCGTISLPMNSTASLMACDVYVPSTLVVVHEELVTCWE